VRLKTTAGQPSPLVCLQLCRISTKKPFADHYGRRWRRPPSPWPYSDCIAAAYAGTTSKYVSLVVSRGAPLAILLAKTGREVFLQPLPVLQTRAGCGQTGFELRHVCDAARQQKKVAAASTCGAYTEAAGGSRRGSSRDHILWHGGSMESSVSIHSYGG